MKVSKTEETQKPIFESFTLNITVETEEEAKAFYAIFNYYPNAELLPAGNGPKLTGLIGGRHMTRPEDEIANGVAYQKFYRPKKNWSTHV